MTPPPIFVDGVSGCSRPIVNLIEPALLSAISVRVLGRPPIDLVEPFGGVDFDCPVETLTGSSAQPCTYYAGCKRHVSFGFRWLVNKSIPSVAKALKEHDGLWCDFLHPSKRGYRVIADQVFDAITAL